MNTNKDKIKVIQTVIGVEADGIIGPNTMRAIEELTPLPAPFQRRSKDYWWHTGIATSFADPADIRAFNKCKAQGGTDEDCFKIGDNGVGCWGDSCGQGSGPSCAIPPDDMIAQFGDMHDAKHARVLVQYNGRSVICTLKDRMPWKRNIKNGAIIDLNPDAVNMLGMAPPITANVAWKWL